MKKRSIKKHIRIISILCLSLIMTLVTSCNDSRLRCHNESCFDIEYKDTEIILRMDGKPDETLHKGGEGYYDSSGKLFLCYQKDTTVYCSISYKTIDTGFYKINHDKKTSLSTTHCYIINRDENNNELSQYYSSFVYDKDYKIKKIIITQGVEYY